MRSKSYLFLLLVLGLGLLSGYLYRITTYNYGLDVRGGLRFTYQLDPEQLAKLRPEARSDAHDRLVQTLQNRAVGPLGVAEPTVIKKGQDQIVIELPGLTDIAKAREIIGTSARIEMYHAKNVVSPRVTFRPYVPVENEKTGTPSVDFTRRSGSDKVIKYGDPEYKRIIDGWELILSGTDLANAEPQANGLGGYQPLMTFSSEGARKMERWSRRYAGDQEMIAAVLDGRVLSIAAVEKDAILSDNAVITGKFPTEWVRNLTNLLKSGSLPIDLVPLSSEKVDPTIGMNALDQMVAAGLVSFGLISLFLIVYYAFPGFVALLALSLYVLFTLTALKLINATFSLAGIAGFILSVGMAVDANILVFERFKEEMKHGRTLHQAIHLGFNRALPAIVDSNACTILTSLVLLQLGTGPVKGFATTLIIGVIISLFTAVFVTRSLLLFFVDSGIGANPKYYALGRNWFGERFEETANEKPLQIVNNYRRWFWISGLSIVVLLPFAFLGGFKPNVEFRGGSEAVFSMEGSQVSSAQILAGLEKAGFEGANVKFGTIAPQHVALSVPKADALAEATTVEAKTEIVADAAGLGGVGVLESEQNADGGVDVTFASSAGLTAEDVEGRLKDRGFEGATATVQESSDQERVAYVTIPPSEKLSAVKKDVDKIAMVADAAGLDVNRNKGYTEVGPAIQRETLQNAILGVVISG
ncbi:MAG TPA: protein translocase subunit SecD, partial [Fimbriimonas sp.]